MAEAEQVFGDAQQVYVGLALGVVGLPGAR